MSAPFEATGEAGPDRSLEANVRSAGAAFEDWRERLASSIRAPEFQRRRAIFEELNPGLTIHPFEKDGVRQPLRDAAVLIPIVQRPEGASVILTVRTNDMPTHAGQISFPGGRAQPEDEGPVETALREAHEEIGLSPDAVSVIGPLGVHVGGKFFAVTPVLAEVDPEADLQACPREVAEIFEAPLSHFGDIANHDYIWVEAGDARYKMFSAPYGEYNVWGLTAGILRTVADALNK